MGVARGFGRALRFISFAVNYPRPSPVRRVAIPLGGAGLFLVEEAKWQRQRKLLAPTFTHPASTFWRRISPRRQEHQVGRLLGVFEQRLTRRAHLRTHGQTAGEVHELARARDYGKVRRELARADRVAETALH